MSRFLETKRSPPSGSEKRDRILFHWKSVDADADAGDVDDVVDVFLCPFFLLLDGTSSMVTQGRWRMKKMKEGWKRWAKKSSCERRYDQERWCHKGSRRC